MVKRIVKTVIHKCLGYKKGEHVLIVCDDKTKALARIFYKTLREEAIEALLLRMAPRHLDAQEPPKEVASALKATDIALLLTSMSLSHTRARKQACSRFGVRVASLPGITPEVLRRSIDIDYTSLKKKVRAVSRRLSRAKKIEVYTDKGTHLVMSVGKRKGFSDDGLYTRPGAFGNLPAGEACIAPQEGKTNGCLVVDGSAPLVGRLKRPVKIMIKDGFAQNIPLAKIASLISPLGRRAKNIAEFGIGLNPKAKVTGNILEDEKATQTAHLAIGASTSFGGKVSCPCHLDFVFLNPVIFIDGKRLKNYV